MTTNGATVLLTLIGTTAMLLLVIYLAGIIIRGRRCSHAQRWWQDHRWGTWQIVERHQMRVCMRCHQTEVKPLEAP